MVVSKTGALLLLAMLVAVVLIAELMEFFVGKSTNNLLALSMLIVAGVAVGWLARHKGIGMPPTTPDTQGAD